VVSDPPAVADDDPAQLTDPHDSSQKLDDRARSYLAVNCSMCHHPRGNAIVSFYLKREMPFEQLNTSKGTGIGTFGMPDARLIVPGDPYRSVLFYRMSKLGYARMPYIGSRVVDSAGVALMEEWIRSLPGQTPGSPSPLLSKDSHEGKALATLNDKSATQQQRAGAIGDLVKSTSGALALAALAHRGVLDSAEFNETATTGSQASAADIRGLFETFLPESKRRPTLGPVIDPQVVLSKSGDVARGKLIYFSDAARCRNCHEIVDKSQSLGPTLLEINKKYPKPAELLQHILQPSLKIDELFAAYVILTTDGRVLSGLLHSQTNEEVVLRTAERKLLRLPQSQIEQMSKSSKSLMPDHLLSDLTAQESADLLEYVRSLGAAPEH
jgi:putative heme-binding domain-containing protein